MKRILSVLLIATLVCTLFIGCGTSSGIYYDYDMTKYVSVGEYSTVIDKETTDYEYAVKVFVDMTFDTQVTEGKVKDGDLVNIDYVGLLDGVAFEGGTASGYDLKIGSNTFIDGFESGLIGAEIGKAVKLDLTFPSNYDNADLAGKAVVFEVMVNYVTIDFVPTEENITRYGFASLADYEAKRDEYALSLCLFYNIYRNATFNEYPQKESNLLYNYLVSYYEEACAANNMTMKDLAESNSMTEDELYDYFKEYEVQNEMDFYMTAYYILSVNDAKLTKEEIETKRAELNEKYEEPLEDVGYYEINIQQAAAYDKALKVLATKGEYKK